MPGAVAVVPSAGAGKRFGARKPFVELSGKPVLRWTVEALAASAEIETVYPVLQEEDMEEAESILAGIPKLGELLKGGPERQDSVGGALRALKGKLEDDTVVLVHDGARPLVTAEIISRCIKGIEGAHGAIAAVPPKDTVKETDGRDMVAGTLRRDILRMIQTPQCFHFGTLLKAYEAAEREGFLATDDAALVEWAGGEVRVVMGSYENIKITTPEDLPVAELFLLGRSRRPA